MRVVAILLLPCFALASPPDAPSVATVRNNLQDLIVGRWQAKDAPKESAPLIEFTTGGTLAIGIGQLGKFSGHYRFLTDDTIEVALVIPGQAKEAKKAKVEIKGDALTITVMEDNKDVTEVTRLTRVK